jgi:hypothetical protein
MAWIELPQESRHPSHSSIDLYSTSAKLKLQFISDRKCRHDSISRRNPAGGFLLLELVQRCGALRWSVPRNKRFTNLQADFWRSECLLPYRC